MCVCACVCVVCVVCACVQSCDVKLTFTANLCEYKSIHEKDRIIQPLPKCSNSNTF